MSEPSLDRQRVSLAHTQHVSDIRGRHKTGSRSKVKKRQARYKRHFLSLMFALSANVMGLKRNTTLMVIKS